MDSNDILVRTLDQDFASLETISDLAQRARRTAISKLENLVEFIVVDENTLKDGDLVETIVKATTALDKVSTSQEKSILNKIGVKLKRTETENNQNFSDVLKNFIGSMKEDVEIDSDLDTEFRTIEEAYNGPAILPGEIREDPNDLT
jgi:hypothetical protein